MQQLIWVLRSSMTSQLLPGGRQLLKDNPAAEVMGCLLADRRRRAAHAQAGSPGGSGPASTAQSRATLNDPDPFIKQLQQKVEQELVEVASKGGRTLPPSNPTAAPAAAATAAGTAEEEGMGANTAEIGGPKGPEPTRFGKCKLARMERLHAWASLKYCPPFLLQVTGSAGGVSATSEKLGKIIMHATV